MFGIYRVILACLVVAEHFGRAGDVGQRAVDSFFVLSGFLMTMLMDGPYRGRIGAFALNRFLRLYPSYWFFAAVTAVLLLAGFAPSLEILGFPPTAFDWLRQVAYLSYHRDTTLVPISWAVTNEIIMYALIAAGIAATGRRALLWLAVGAVYNVAAWLLTDGQEYRYFLPLAASFPFAVGACLWQFRDRLLPAARPLPALLAVSAAAAALFALGMVLTMLRLSGWAVWVWNLHIAASAMLTLCLYRLGPLVPAWLRAIDKAVGHVSYPIYLNHFAAAMLVLPLGLPRFRATLAIIVVAALGGVLSYWLIDRWVEALRNRVRPAPAAAAATAEPTAGPLVNPSP